VILDKIDKGGWRLASAVHTARFATVRGDFALISKSFGERTGNPFFRGISEILVIRLRLARRQHVHGIVKIIVPLGGKERG
jgi:hypothetical protein